MMEPLTAEDRREGFSDKKSTEYRVLYMDEYGDIHEWDDYDRLPEARTGYAAAAAELQAGRLEYKGVGLERRNWIVRSVDGFECDGDFEDCIIADTWIPGYPLEIE